MHTAQRAAPGLAHDGLDRAAEALVLAFHFLENADARIRTPELDYLLCQLFGELVQLALAVGDAHFAPFGDVPSALRVLGELFTLGVYLVYADPVGGYLPLYLVDAGFQLAHFIAHALGILF